MISEDKKELSDAVFADNFTTPEEWQDVGQRLQEHGFTEAALRLLAIMTTAVATKGALSAMKKIREEEAAEERRRAAQEAQEKLHQGKKSRSKKSKPQVVKDEGETNGETLQLTKKNRKVEISDTVEVQNSTGRTDISSTRFLPTPQNVGATSAETAESAKKASLTVPGKPAHLEISESSTLESSFIDDKSRSGADSDYLASGGETSESEVDGRPKHRLPKPRPPVPAESTDLEDTTTNEGYEADVE